MITNTKSLKRGGAKLFIATVASLSIIACTPSTDALGGKSPAEVQLAIQPFGAMEGDLLDTVLSSIKASYGFEVTLLPVIELPESAFINVKSPRYRADTLLSYLKRIKQESFDYILGLTAKDISSTKLDVDGNVKLPKSRYEDWGIFGLGYRPGLVCVISTFRLKNPNRNLFIERLIKVCLHEIGHNLGLPHCTIGERCVMRDAAETIRTVDNVDAALCEHCLEKI
ncbi:MAG: archaemetzincin [Crocinitomicaceae bacterium]|jgi:archaemetzincin